MLVKELLYGMYTCYGIFIRRIVILSAPLKINKKRPIQYEPV